MMRFITCCLPLFIALPLQADGDAEAYRLLKSWGMQFDASGKLHFQLQQQKAAPSAERWAPDISGFQSKKSKSVGDDPLQPLVITSKKAAKK